MSVVSVILGGGEGSRLQPLTQERSKPAVPIAGRFRLVDIPISNCINNGLNKTYLLTQFNSVSLHEHINSSYRFDDFSSSFVRILAAQQTPNSKGWFTGTADAVRQAQTYLRDERPEHVVILSGDQLYRLDFRHVIQQHIDKRADVTIATKPVPREEAGSLGIMQIDGQSRIANFVEKPGDTPELDDLKSPGDQYLASMGIYIFKTDVLLKLLNDNPEKTDFGKNIIPMAIQNHQVFSYVYTGYWKDIGTIGMFHAENLALTDPLPAFDFYDPSGLIYSRRRNLPPSKVVSCTMDRTIVTEGCIIEGSLIRHSIVGVRGYVGAETEVHDSYIMGADYFNWEEATDPSHPQLGIGRRCKIENAIIDKNARIGDEVMISPAGKKEGEKTDLYVVRDGVIVIPKNTVIPSGTVL